MNQEQLSNQLVERRASLGLSMRDVAEQSGVSPSTLSRIERKEGTFDFDVCMRLAKWLGVPKVSEGATVAYEPNILAAICRHIREDKNLTPENAETLCRIITAAYEGATRIAEARELNKQLKQP